MKVILTPVGSAGDIDPFVMIGRELRRRGHDVTLVAAAVFDHAASHAGLHFVPIGTSEQFERTTKNPDLWHWRRGPSIVFGTVADLLRPMYAGLEELYEPGRTMLVGHSLSFVTRTFEEVHRVPAVTVHLAPSVFRSDFEQPILPSGQDFSSWPVWAKRSLWWMVDRVAIDPLLLPKLNPWRAELGLPPVSRVFRSWLHSPQLVLGLFPEWFGPPQPDWPPQLRLTGFVLSDERCAPDAAASNQATPLDESAFVLERFLSSGDPPVVVTPGSANRHAARFLRVGLEAATAVGRRVVLVTRFREHLPASLPAHALHVNYAPFATLFPRAAAVVHHGGVGTCAQAMAAGTPQLIMPIVFDQPDNAARAKRLGVAEVIRPAHSSPNRGAAALERLLSSRDVQTACADIRARIKATHAVERACDLIEEQYRRAAGDPQRGGTMTA